MMNTPRPLLVASVAALLALTAACSTAENDGAGPDSASADPGEATCEGKVIGDSIPQGSDPALSMVNDGFTQQAATYGMEVHSADANLDVNQQISDVDSFVQRGMDGLSIWPMDTQSLRASMERAQQEGLSVVTHQTLEGDRFTTNVQFDDFGAGRSAALYLGEQLEPGAQVAVITGPQQVDSFRNLAEGFLAGAEEAGLEVVDVQNNNELSPQASASMTEQFKTRYGSSLGGIFDSLNVTALASAAILDADFDPLIVTYEGSAETVQAIEDGRIAATIYVPNILSGRAKAWAFCQSFLGEELPRDIYIPHLIADADNVAALPTESGQAEAEVEFSLVEVGDRQMVDLGGMDLPESAVAGE